jgi:hypothetical protein
VGRRFWIRLDELEGADVKATLFDLPFVDRERLGDYEVVVNL